MTAEILTSASLMRIGSALLLVLVAAVISRWQVLDLEKHMATAVVRAFLQLVAIGYALTYVFQADNPIVILLILCVMISTAGYTAGQRGRATPHAKRIAFLAIGFGGFSTLFLLVALNIFDFTARQVIPIAGMVIGNSMNVCSLVMKRVADDVRAHKSKIEAALALGATSRQAIRPYLHEALHTGMTPIIDTTKTVGLIQLPGAMTGMILAGASPLQAVVLQIIVMYMLIGAAALTGLAAGWLTYRQFFTTHHQIRPEAMRL